MSGEKTGESSDNGLSSRIRRHYGELSPTEKILADVVLDCPGDVAAYSATELAALAGVSKMTVSRLVRRLGYANFEEARLASRGAVEPASPLLLLDKRDGGDGAATGLPEGLEAYFRSSIDAVVSTARLCDPAVIAATAQALHDARRVWVCGQRISAFLAGYARWQFIQFRGDVHMLAGAGETYGEALAEIGPDDLLFLVAMRRRSPAVCALMRTAAARGIRTALLIDNHSPLEIPPPPLTLRCRTRSPSALDNHVAAMAIVNALTADLIRLTGEEGRRRIADIEALHEDLGEM